MSTLVLGAFDLLHWGHISFIREAQRLGAPVVVGLTTDMLLEETKRTPILKYDDRRRGIEALGCQVIPRSTPSATDLFLQVKPKAFACGTDWIGDDHLESAGLTVDFLNRHGILLVYLPRNHDMSTSRIIELVKESV